MTPPALVSVAAPLDPVRAALVGFGATAQHRRSVAFDLGADLVVLDYDPDDAVTTLAVGGVDSLATARWLADQLDDLGLVVETVLPPLGVDAARA